MTDLENLWDDLPVGPAPTGEILRAARAQSRPRRNRRRLLRPLSSVAALAAIGGAFVVGTYVASPPASTPEVAPPGGSGAEPAAFHGELVAAESCDALLDYYVERGVELVGPYGWGSGYGHRDLLGGRLLDSIPADGRLELDQLNSGARGSQEAPGFAAAPTAPDLSKSNRAPAPASQRAESSGTGTNVQEADVDEPDVVKTDGERLFRIKNSKLTTYDVTGAEPEQLSALDLGDFEDGEILLAGDTVVAIGNDGTQEKQPYYDGPAAPSPMTRVLSVNVSDPAKPEVTDTVDFDSSLVTARQHGDTVRLIASAGLPDLDFVRPGNRKGGPSWKEALRRNEALVQETTISDWLPTGSVNGGADKRLAECEDVAVPKTDLGLDTISVVGFDAADPTSWDVTALAASAPLAYASGEHLYLGATPTDWGGCFDVCPTDTFGTRNEELGTTHLFDFELTTTGTSYVGAGEVDGLVQDRWAMDEYDGTLRLAVSPTERTGNFNSVVTMRRDGDALVEVGRLDKLGPNETIQSVRWFDGLAILVTFRQMDPLYTVDLTDPKSPTLMGELKIPGFSAYLHPLGPGRLLGIGEGPTDDRGGRGGWGAQAGLFKVSDLTDPLRLDVVSYASGTEALAGADPRQFTWLPSERTALTVISKGWRGRTGWVSVLSLGDGKMSNRMVEAEHGVEIADLRLVPLPDGRVVMSTGDGAEFFDL